MNPRPLATKLAKIMGELHRVPKNGRNEFHKYDYVTESDIVDALRRLLSDQGVMILPSVVAHTTSEADRKQTLATVTLELTLIDGESGDTLTSQWVGQGMDQGDKAYYKAYTGAMKYAMLKTFLISTGDDPEQDAPAQHEPRQQQREDRRQRNQPKQQHQQQPPQDDAHTKALRRLYAVLGEVCGDDKDLKERVATMIKREEGVRLVKDLTTAQLHQWSGIITPDWLKRALGGV